MGLHTAAQVLCTWFPLCLTWSRMFDPKDEAKITGPIFQMRQLKSRLGSDLPKMTQVHVNQLNMKTSIPTLS